MNKKDYFKYYIQGSDHYLIPKDIFDELFNELNNWKEESKELNQKYLNAVVDYEITMSDKTELEKQLEEKENIACNWKDSCLENAGKIEELEAQQKEFIEYMNKTMEECNNYSKYIEKKTKELHGRSYGKTYIANEIMKNEVAKKILKETLSKYKSIIGDDK